MLNHMMQAADVTTLALAHLSEMERAPLPRKWRKHRAGQPGDNPKRARGTPVGFFGFYVIPYAEIERMWRVRCMGKCWNTLLKTKREWELRDQEVG
jgi:hypothetical protein